MYVITGGSDGLGLALANVIVAKGKRAVSLSRSEPKTGTKRTKIGHIPCDLTNEGSINAAAQQVLAMDEPIEALINCAGVYRSQPLVQLTGQEAALTFTTNIIGPLLLTARLAERIRKDGADIVNIDSTSALKEYDNEVAYSTSKWAMRGFSKNLQHDFKGTKTRVINVCPSDFSENPEDVSMNTADIANFMWQILCLPKNMEISEVIINRK
jgi:NAD(P)-dependent dehydrogenase (short-subunit alcohol dehydrogenase family)